MKSDRWLQVERLYNSVLEHKPEEREHYLSQACAGDESLRQEVESLLSCQGEAEKFIEKPALEVEARAIAADRDAVRGDLTGREFLHYRIVEKIGAGGMGEVFLAEDISLDRKVALKFLPHIFSKDPERLARFEREAKLLASLNHPDIAAIYGLEQSEGERFLVLELVEGETLAQRITSGPVPVEEALEICRQIAEGLEIAHEKGIIHRDLKPANVKITPDGKVKVLDFGLAKAFQDERSAADVNHSPSITEHMTRPGVILGTAAYMSPEQARGGAVDKRADIWAFGCILYECMTGRAPFKGETITETVAKILEGTPDWDLLPVNTPWRIRDLLHHCLQKNPKERLRDIGDARIEIVEALSQPAVREPVPETKAHQAWKGIALFLGLLVVGMAATIIHSLFRTIPSTPVVRAKINLPTGRQLIAGTEPTGKLLTQNRTELDVSPDGRHVVYSASIDGRESDARLYRHALEDARSEEIPGTEGARTPFFSPDGKWIGFWARNKLWKIPASGGIPILLCDGGTGPLYGASWSPGGRIAIGTPADGLQSVDAGGGKLENLTILDAAKEATHRLPHFLPKGKALLCTVMPLIFGTRAHIEVLSLESGKRKVLIEDGADARYLPTGHLVFVREGTLMAAPFDSDRLELKGPAVPVVKGVMQAINFSYSYDNSGAGQFAVSQSGLLVYASGGIAPDADIELVWLDRQGKVEPIHSFGKRPATNPRLSPDGQKLACTTEGIDANVWVYDLPRHVAARLTSEGRANKVVWTPDGNRVVFDFWRAGNPYLSWLRSDGGGSIEPLNEPKYASSPGSWSPDGRYLSFVARDPISSFDIYLLRMEDRQITPFLKTEFAEGWPEFSPDGHWLAYSSNESGRYEVYVTSIPGKDRKILISNEGGCEPLWARNGRELFYWDVERKKLMVVDISTQPSFHAGTQRMLFEHSKESAQPIRGYDISPDGKRFLIPQRSETKTEPVTELNLVLNWFEELKRLAPTGRK